MGTEWLILVGLFIIVAVMTYGVFVNASEARRELEAHQDFDQLSGGSSALSKRLDASLDAASQGGEQTQASVLETLLAKELADADMAERRGLSQEARIHRDLAESIERHLAKLQRGTANS